MKTLGVDDMQPQWDFLTFQLCENKRKLQELEDHHLMVRAFPIGCFVSYLNDDTREAEVLGHDRPGRLLVKMADARDACEAAGAASLLIGARFVISVRPAPEVEG